MLVSQREFVMSAVRHDIDLNIFIFWSREKAVIERIVVELRSRSRSRSGEGQVKVR